MKKIKGLITIYFLTILLLAQSDLQAESEFKEIKKTGKINYTNKICL